MDVKNREPGLNVLKKAGLVLGPVLFFAVMLIFDFEPGRPAVTRMAAITVWMAFWWVTDCVPLFVTSLLPMILFPLLGILKAGDTAPLYINSTIFLFMGGFMIALTMEKWHLHQRIALFVIKTIGGGPSRIILGFMMAAAFLSMWISNTGTALMMVPIGLAVIIRMEERFPEKATHNFSVGLMLGIAYACSLGGMATLVGTPPNLALARIFKISFPQAPEITFAKWLIMGLPLSLALIALVWIILTKVFFRVPSDLVTDKSLVCSEYQKLGPMTFEQKVVLTVFMVTAFLWIFRVRIDIGVVSIPGWSTLLPYPEMFDDGSVAMLMALILFLIPTRSPGADSRTIGSDDILKKIPWEIVLLFGGGFALAEGFKISGLSEFIGGRFRGLEGMSTLGMIALVCLGMTFLTEVTSNTASTQMILLILSSLSVNLGINPLLLMIPVTLSASCAFMMPVGTPPNAIVFAGGRIKIAEMAKAGFIINLVGVVVVTLFFYFIGTAVFSIDTGTGSVLIYNQ